VEKGSVNTSSTLEREIGSEKRSGRRAISPGTRGDGRRGRGGMDGDAIVDEL
jgi:hypothetical protein